MTEYIKALCGVCRQYREISIEPVYGNMNEHGNARAEDAYFDSPRKRDLIALECLSAVRAADLSYEVTEAARRGILCPQCLLQIGEFLRDLIRGIRQNYPKAEG